MRELERCTPRRMAAISCCAGPASTAASRASATLGACSARSALALGEPAQLLFRLLSQRVVVALGYRGEQLGPVVQRRRDRARGSEQRPLLALEQEALHFVDVQRARERQRKQREGHQRELGAQADPQAHGGLYAFQR